MTDLNNGIRELSTNWVALVADELALRVCLAITPHTFRRAALLAVATPLMESRLVKKQVTARGLGAP
jgi:hypothetical protein